jgi:Tfp pilus assembly protein PilF
MEKMAKYGEASDMFERAGELPCAAFNAGLCKLLHGDLAGAKADLENAIRQDRERALNYYVMAILGARLPDNQLLVLNIKRAVQLDGQLVDKAGRDLEFRKFFDNAEFQVAIRP